MVKSHILKNNLNLDRHVGRKQMDRCHVQEILVGDPSDYIRFPFPSILRIFLLGLGQNHQLQ